MTTQYQHINPTRPPIFRYSLYVRLNVLAWNALQLQRILAEPTLVAKLSPQVLKNAQLYSSMNLVVGNLIKAAFGLQ